MANIREIAHKVSSLRNMQKVMRAMNMIASTKLHRILSRVPALHAFEEDTMALARDLAVACGESGSPLIGPLENCRQAGMLVFTSDKGLCGAHNNSVHRACVSLAASLKNQGVAVDSICIGTRGASFCRRNDMDIYMSVESNDRILTDAELRRIAETLIERIEKDEIQAVYAVFNSFVSPLQQIPRSLQILPLCSLAAEQTSESRSETGLTFDSAGSLSARSAVSTVLYFLLQCLLRHSHLSEYAARMTAMDNATNNSEDLIARYGAIRNRARQTAITNELIEIVAGKEALKD